MRTTGTRAQQRLITNTPALDTRTKEVYFTYSLSYIVEAVES